MEQETKSDIIQVSREDILVCPHRQYSKELPKESTFGVTVPLASKSINQCFDRFLDLEKTPIR
jgi:hypothetical protein